MTLNIEQERQPFCDAVRSQHAAWSQETDEKILRLFSAHFVGWTIAKRAAMGAAEPVDEPDYRDAFKSLCQDIGLVTALLGLDGYNGVDPVLRAITNLIMKSAAPPAPVSAEPVLYRCFHCHEEFHDVESAGLHFGRSQVFDPACTIDIARFREMEQRMICYNEEDAEIHQQMAGLRNQHAIDLRREEEKGYARGLRDAVKYPHEVAPPSADAKDGELLDFLDRHAVVTFSFDRASIEVDVPESFEGANLVREVIQAAKDLEDAQ